MLYRIYSFWRGSVSAREVPRSNYDLVYFFQNPLCTYSEERFTLYPHLDDSNGLVEWGVLWEGGDFTIGKGTFFLYFSWKIDATILQHLTWLSIYLLNYLPTFEVSIENFKSRDFISINLLNRNGRK